MSIVSELKKRAGPQARVRAAPSRRLSFDAEPVRLVLRKKGRSQAIGDVFELARLLVRAGVPVRGAKRAVDDLVEGRVTVAEVRTDDVARLRSLLAGQRVTATELRPREVDVKELRSRLGISQEAFAARYCLDVATVRNWEQGRTRPEGAAAAFLQIIERAPDQVVELLSEPET